MKEQKKHGDQHERLPSSSSCDYYCHDDDDDDNIIAGYNCYYMLLNEC